jgi:uncharacterized RDD family membrane protein YckC
MNDYSHLLQPRTAKIIQEAGFLRRALAFFFDLMVLRLMLAAIFSPLFEDVFSRAEQGFGALRYTQAEIGAVLFLFALIYLYFVLFEYTLGQTPGQMLANIRVEGSGKLGPLMIRNSFIFPVLPFILFWVVEPIAIIFWKRGVLELLSGTRTLHQRRIII